MYKYEKTRHVCSSSKKAQSKSSLCGMASVWARISRGNKRTKGGKKITGASQPSCHLANLIGQ